MTGLHKLTLDHIPLQTADLSRLRGAFETLGFIVTPPGAYTSPDFAGARWPNRCVFLRQGWFDLLEAPGLDSGVPVTPRGALFRTDDLDAAIQSFSDLRMEAPYQLERRWDRDLGLPPELFRLFSLRERIAPVGVAVIEHAWPCTDSLPAWFEHPNGALGIVGISFGDASPGPAASQCAARLDLSVFDYVDADAFEARYVPLVRQIAIRICVRDLNQTAEALDLRGVACEWDENELVADLVTPLGCVFAFTE